jgi:hypothetical protein
MKPAKGGPGRECACFGPCQDLPGLDRAFYSALSCEILSDFYVSQAAFIIFVSLWRNHMFTANQDYLKLPGSYLFSTVAKKTRAFTDAHPEAKIIRLGIGDVTRPLPLP